MKKFCVLGLAFCFLLTGCTISTPEGTTTITFDANNKSDEVVVSLGSKTYTLDTDSLDSYLNQLLSSVSVPSTSTSDELIDFVHKNLNSLGLDLNNLDDSDAIQVEDSIKETLEDQGVDTSDLNIDLISLLEEE